jgi:hypothetical protein
MFFLSFAFPFPLPVGRVLLILFLFIFASHRVSTSKELKRTPPPFTKELMVSSLVGPLALIINLPAFLKVIPTHYAQGLVLEPRVYTAQVGFSAELGVDLISSSSFVGLVTRMLVQWMDSCCDGRWMKFIKQNNSVRLWVQKLLLLICNALQKKCDLKMSKARRVNE